MRVQCDATKVSEFDYSGLGREFDKLSKSAKRALVNNKIYNARDLAERTKSEVMSPHALGPSALPTLTAALKTAGLNFER